MSGQLPPRPPTRRAPLGDATKRVNNAQHHQKIPSKVSYIPNNASPKAKKFLQVLSPAPVTPISQNEKSISREPQRRGSPPPNFANPRLSAISKRDPDPESNRNSQISTVSTNASDGTRIKGHIGPWKLGKTLGKGATARVRLARHAYTGQEAAIKIVQKRNAQLSQAGSLAALDKVESSMPDSEDGIRRMPIGIEREVAIMKLIQHPNIMKLYDIWENRTEIYLVLEYVDNGELFEQIAQRGGLPEEEAMKYFRQMLSAVGYCHSFNICHRDLKPENILITKDKDLKIADFGMAALHQSPSHKLKTSCGSPHYAAPELIRGVNYRGDKVDIWSMGIILYVTLAGRLPFDVDGTGKEWISQLLWKIKKGSYEMAPEFSEDAANLIWRVLQVNPRDRINLSQIWRHPLLRKYDYLDNLGGGVFPQSPSVNDCGRPVGRRSDISKEMLRHLRSMWHQLSEQQLMDALLSEESNDQKLFYGLLIKYHDEQLENYIPDLGYSSSDYHHNKPAVLKKTYSTCNFSQIKGKGHGRQMSRFTVISNAAETEQSYDPFKASRPQHLDAIRHTERPKVTIHRSRDEDNGCSPKIRSRLRMPAASSGQQKLAPPRVYASRSSLASSTRSRGTTPYGRPAAVYKRGVSFSHLRSGSSSQRNFPSRAPRGLRITKDINSAEVASHRGDTQRSVDEARSSGNYIRSRKGKASEPRFPIPRVGRTSQIWTEDVRQLSSGLAKDCDEAFNRTSVIPESQIPESACTATYSSDSDNQNQFIASSTTETTRKSKCISLEARPLPAPPSRTDSVKRQLVEARKQAELRKKSGGDDSPGYLDRMVSHIDRLMQPQSPTQSHPDRRASSAPMETRYRPSNRHLPSIYEDISPRRASDPVKALNYVRPEGRGARVAPARESRPSNTNYMGDGGTRMTHTIRLVEPPSPYSPVKAPAPLTIRKKSSRGGPAVVMSGGLDLKPRPSTQGQTSRLDLRHKYIASSGLEVAPTADPIEADHRSGHDNRAVSDASSSTISRKPTWFRRNSKGGEDDLRNTNRGSDALTSQSSSNDTDHGVQHLNAYPAPSKNRKFSLRGLFKKRNPKSDMTATYYDIDDTISLCNSMVEAQRQSHAGRSGHHEDPRVRQIEPQRNWLAKLFHVKPVSKFVCFSVSRRRARQEITTILREWKRYGIREVQVDKERNIVFGRVGAKNYLDMKEVAFAGEVMTVIEHGKKSYLSIARFTQEQGAASSFNKVVETLESVLKVRGMLVSDERKKRMMIKTLNSM